MSNNCIDKYQINKGKAFNNLTRMHDDKCFVSGEDRQNINRSWFLSNYHQCCLHPYKFKKFALTEPTLY